jgi:putative transposase
MREGDRKRERTKVACPLYNFVPFIISVIRYIEGNAVRAGLAASATQWKWSSHPERVSGDTGILSGLPIALPDDWTNYVDEPQTDSELEKLRRSVNRQTPYGDEEWQLQISNKLGLGSTMNARGRPKTRERAKVACPLYDRVSDMQRAELIGEL